MHFFIIFIINIFFKFFNNTFRTLFNKILHLFPPSINVPNCPFFFFVAGAHTLGFSHCSKFASRIYSTPVDPTLNKQYVAQLQQMCPRNVDPRIAINMDPTTPRKFDNVYYQNLQQGKGLFTSDQILFTDPRSRNTVNSFASSSNVFNSNFVAAMTKLGRVGVKTARNGKIRTDCSVL